MPTADLPPFNPYAAPEGSNSEDRAGTSNWIFAICAGAVYFGIAAFLFGLLPAYIRMRGSARPEELTFENLSRNADDRFFVALGLAGPIAFAAALLDFVPATRMGLIRSVAISGGVLLATLFVVVFGMLIFDSLVAEVFVRDRNSRGATAMPAYWGALAMGYLPWLTVLAFILKRRLRRTGR